MTAGSAVSSTARRLRRAASFLDSPLGVLLAVAGILVLACPLLAPLTARSLSAHALGLASGKGYDFLVHSNAQGRPFEVCPGFEARRAELVDGIAGDLEQIEARTSWEILRIPRLVRRFDDRASRFYGSDCQEDWSYRYDFVDYQKGLLGVAPQLWLFESLGLSIVYPALLQLIAAWIGVLSLFWITRKLAGSTLAGIVAVALLAGVLQVFDDLRLDILNTLTLILVAMTLAAPPSARLAGARVLALSRDATAVLAFAVLALLFLFVPFIPSRIDAALVPPVVILVGLIQRRRATIVRGVAALAVLFAVMAPFNRHSAELLSPVSSVNTAKSEEMKIVQLVQFLFERPNHFGQFILDHNFLWMFDQDHFVQRHAPALGLHQSGPAWGRTFLLQTLAERPLEFPEAWWKRFFVQVVDHQRLSLTLYGSWARPATWFFWIALATLALSLVLGSHPHLAWPAASVVLWEVFGLHTFLALVHAHAFYLQKGIALLWCFFPAYLGLTLRQLRTWHQSPLGRAVAVLSRRRGLQVFAGAGVLVALIAAPSWIREARKELHATNVWRAIHVGTQYAFAHRTPDEIEREIERIRALGHEPPGVVDMYAAWVFFGYGERTPYYVRFFGPAAIQENAARALELMAGHYQRALAEAPDHPHLPVFAGYLGDPAWADRYREALAAFPDHPYASRLSWLLATESALPAADKLGYLRVYERSVGKLLAETARYRPGFRRLPGIEAGEGDGELAVEAGEAGVVVELAGGRTANVEAVDVYGSDRAKVGIFIHVLDGRLVASLIDASGFSLAGELEMVPEDAERYRVLRAAGNEVLESLSIRLRAGEGGARFVVRDLYPMIENPRFFRGRTAPEQRTGMRLADLRSLSRALESYRSDHGAFPLSPAEGWVGLYNDWGPSAKEWIPGLVPDYLPSLPRDPRMSTDGMRQYLYRSNGRDYKLLAFYPEGDCKVVREKNPELLDPLRGGDSVYPCHAYGFWSPGAAHW